MIKDVNYITPLLVSVIGGTGQLGHFVTKHIYSKGHKTKAIGIGKLPEKGFLPDDTKIEIADTGALRVNQLADLLQGSDVVIHAAGADGRALFDTPAIEGYRKQNVDAVRNLIEAMKKIGSKKLILLGSYYTYIDRVFPDLKIPDYSPYVKSRVEQAQLVLESTPADWEVGILELPYIFGAAPGRGTLWNFYIDMIQQAVGSISVHSGGSACITMNQVGIAAANACEKVIGKRFFPIGNSNLKYKEIFEIFAEILGSKIEVIAKPDSYFLDDAIKQAEKLISIGKESAYDPIKLLEWESLDFYIDPSYSMELLQFQKEDMRQAIMESVEATLKFESKGPGSRLK
jgi:nucleoside-diphosphate-sugar epimerase